MNEYKGIAVSVAPNGYHYVKWDGKRRLLHHVIAEEKLGRALEKDERVSFIDKDRTNFDPSNIEVRKKLKSKENRIDFLKDRISMDIDELIQLEVRVTDIAEFITKQLS